MRVRHLRNEKSPSAASNCGETPCTGGNRAASIRTGGGGDGRFRTTSASVRTDGGGSFGEDRDRYRLLCEQVRRHGVFVLDCDGRVAEWGDGARRLLGHDADAAVGEPLAAFYTEEDAADGLPRRMLERAEADGEVVDEGWRVRTDGSRFWGRFVVTALRTDESLTGYGVVATDLTEAPDKLRSYDTLVEAPVQLVGLAEPDGTLVEANKTALEFAGVERADAVGAPLWETPWWSHSEADRERLRDAVETASTGEFVRYETTVAGTDGEVLTVDFSLTPVTDEDGDVAALVPEGRDVTERKRTEAELRERNRMFSTLVDNLPGIAYRCENERDWPMSFVSAGCSDLTGYDPAEIEAGHVSWGEDVIHPDDRERVWEDVQAAIDDREPFTLTYQIRRADGTERWVWEQGEGVFEGDELVAIEGFITDVTERRQRQRRLEAVFDQTYQFTGLLEPDGTVLEANETALAFGGLDRAEVVGEPFWEAAWFQMGPETRERVREDVRRAAEGEFVRHELDVRGSERVATIDFSIRPVTDERGEVELLVPEGRDITERTRRESQLETLNEVSRELTEAESTQTVCDTAVSAAGETLGLALAAVELYDSERNRLVPRARSDAVAELVGDESLFAPENGESWQVFVESEGSVYEDIEFRADVSGSGTPLDSAIVLPLGQHGVFIAGETTAESFSEADVDLARVLAAHVETALDRVDREASLRERTTTLEAKTERLERMDRVNEVVRDVTKALVSAGSRAEIESTVCERLAGAGPYQFAWFGTRDPVSDEVRPTARAGDEAEYLDAVTAVAGGPEPAGRAADEHATQVASPARTDPPLDQWEQAALERDYRTVVSVPVRYEEALYGVLTVYGSDPDHLGEAEQAVLSDLGEMVGYAITAVERKTALTSDRRVELEFGIEEPDTPLFRCVRAVGGEFELEGVVSGGSDPLRAFFTLRDADPDAVREFAAESPGLGEIRHVAGEGSESLFECPVVGGSIVGTVFDHGGVPQSLTGDGTTVRLVAELSADRDVREFARMFETAFEGATLLARRERDRPIQTATEFRSELLDRFTDKQREAIETAYLSGFFEWPRESTGEEVAEALDVSQPTFNRHLRASQRKLLDLLLDE
ncbi:PAS domain S-box protein [Haloarcula nitratireducens]|uniref:PAS domain S-box protein n=1 Tax=Haloarcula nitratireducens TaxID=2487749 RepID=A0AAW4PBA0_9EURY|nr:PAS domain S-box protein [Halomicroarcula nitratireducens]MBX0295144.1 PAS domain S-box protein [Halomicroarcula nitratireducens]